MSEILSKDVEAAEKASQEESGLSSYVAEVDGSKSRTAWEKCKALIVKWGVENDGLAPLPESQKTDTNYLSLFFLWLTVSLNLLPITTGYVATNGYGLSLRDASLSILFFSLLTGVPMAYITTLGPKLGCRTMIATRFSFGYFGASIVSCLNAATLMGYAILAAILGGQCLAAINGTLSDSVGIVICCVICLVIAFFGKRVMFTLEKYAWFGVLLAIVVALGTGGKQLRHQQETEPATAYSVLSVGALMAGFFLTWSGLSMDYTLSYVGNAPSKRIFWYTYSGLIIGALPLLILGAAMGGATSTSESWTAANDAYGNCGIFAVMLHPVHGFGKFLMVLLALGLIGNLTVTMYSVGISCQVMVPWLLRVPRFIMLPLLGAILIPVSIVGANSFSSTLTAFLGVIGYWCACYSAVFLEEHFIFRKANCDNYNLEDWENWRKLPSGIAALAASICSFGLIVPSMAQTWYTGPIGKTAGDIGFETGAAVTAVLYPIFRKIEIKVQGRV